MDEKKPEVKEEVKTPTLEDLQKQIEALMAENNSLKADAEKVKKTISNANADAASYKRERDEWKEKYRATLDEAKRKEEERAEADEAIRAELTALKTEKRISTYTAKLLEVGYDAQTAASMAMNLPEGISDDFFNQQKSFLETQKQIAKTNAINNQSSMSVGETPSATKDDEMDAKLKKWFYGN